MTTSTPELKTAAAPGIDWADVAGQWFKAYRAGFDTVLGLSNAALAGAERMQMVQLEADVETQTRNRTAALAVGDCRDVQGLLALQSNLATAYMESAMRYGTTFAQLAQQTNAEIAKLLTARYEEWGRFVRGALPVGSANRVDAAAVRDRVRGRPGVAAGDDPVDRLARFDGRPGLQAGRLRWGRSPPGQEGSPAVGGVEGRGLNHPAHFVGTSPRRGGDGALTPRGAGDRARRRRPPPERGS